jgi:5'-3' exonuclease
MQNNITPLFIFDGAKPKEKTEELIRRRESRKKAWEKYDSILNNLKEEELNSFRIKKELSRLKRQCVKVKHSHIEDVKNLITCFGMTYIVADGEADKLCAELVIHKKAYACMSDDMDLFMYGCPLVLRLFNVQRKTLIIYKLDDILSSLKMDLDNFKIMCILSGTDYNINYNKNNIFKIYKTYLLYIKRYETKNNFLEWIVKQNINYNIDDICNTLELFYVDRHIQDYNIKQNTFVDKITLYKLLEKEYFLNPITVY